MAAILDHLLALTLLVPLTGACVLLLVGRARPTAARWVALATTVASLLAIAPLWFIYDPDGKTWQFAERFSVGAAAGVSVYFGVDGTSILLLFLTAAIALVTVLASWQSIGIRVREFYLLLLAAEAGAFGVFIALDLVVFFISWQMTFASLYLLTIGWGRRVRATAIAYSWIGIGVLLGAGMLTLYFSNSGPAHSSDITLLHTRTLSPSLQSWVFILFLLAFSATMGVFPLHSGALDALTTAPTSVALFIAAVLTKIGGYGIFRLLLPLAPDACRQVAPLVAGIAIGSMFAAAVAAWRQRELRRLIAYANASQMAVMMLALFALTPVGIGISLAHQIGHGFWVAGLLACAGILLDRTGDAGVSSIAGLRKRMPILAGLFAILVAAAAGIFALVGLLDDAAGLRGPMSGNGRWALVAASGLFVSLLYLVPLVRRIFGGDGVTAPGINSTLSGRELAVLVPVAAFAVIAGVYPAPVLQRIETSVGRVVARIHPETAPYLRLGSDCPTAAPPDPGGPPPGFILVEPCADGTPVPPKL
jgi:NADH-quinone oxidoreductase subunit M